MANLGATMRRSGALLAAAAILTACGGCGDLGFRWPWESGEPAPAAGNGGGARAAATTRPAPQPVQIDPNQEIVAACVVQVNDRYVGCDDVLDALDPVLANVSPDTPEEVFRTQVTKLAAAEVRDQAVRLMVLSEAERRTTDEQKKFIRSKAEEELRKRITEAGSRAQFEADLRARGLSSREFVRIHRETILSQMYLQSKFVPKLAVNRQMIWDYYRKHPEEFSTPKRVAMQLIAAPFYRFLDGAGMELTPSQRAAALPQAEAVIEAAQKELAAGAGFDQVARKHSRGIKAKAGGLWPMIEQGNFIEPDVEKAAFALPQGGVSGVVRTPSGLYIVRAAQVEAAKATRFEDAQDAIAEKLRNAQYVELQREYFRRLWAEATIVQSPKFLETIVNLAIARYRG
jgi:hypothetical protein